MNDAEARTIAAGAWNTPENRHKPIDQALAAAFVDVVKATWDRAVQETEYSQWCESMGEDL